MSVVAKTFLTKNGSSYIAAPSLKLLKSHANLKVAKNPNKEMGLLGSKKCAFICD